MWVKSDGREKLVANANTPTQRKKPLSYQGLKDGAGDRGRTDDLMLGKHRRRKKR